MEILDIVEGGEINIVHMDTASNINTAWPLSGALRSQVSSIAQPLWLSAEIDAVSCNSGQSSLPFANDLSRIMAIAGRLVVSAPILSESLRITSFVSRLPKAPLASLFISLFLHFTLTLCFA